MIVAPKTKKGKERIKRFGNEWLLIRTSDTVPFAQRNGPWGYIRPANRLFKDEERWIHLIDDHDFDIVSL